MLYTEFKVKDEVLKLRLTTRDCVALESKLGRNPLDEIMGVDDNKLPTFNYIISVLHAALQTYQSNYNLEAVYDLFDKHVEDGGNLLDLIAVITDVFKVSGFFKGEVKGEEKKVQAKKK